MFFASWAATLGHAAEWMGSIPFAAGGRLVAPADPLSAAAETPKAIRPRGKNLNRNHY